MKTLKKIGIILIVLFSIIGIYFGSYWIALNTAETPIFELPVHNLNDVTGVQVFHDNRSTDRIHHGFDFKLENDIEIFAPIGGKITGVEKKQMFNGLWIIDVKIRINLKWSMYIAFEPDTDLESVIDAQILNITVKKGDNVVLNQSLGILNPVPGSGFPHIHWNINRQGFLTSETEDVSPYDYCSPHAKQLLYSLCQKFGKLPEDSII